ncbi:hypothetical protein V8Z80_04640 [Orrella sp. JC864]|uniref:hypothetical protein n=1 Tax=Orrella sp. JC864 TaxID=3120298 RepID=UPI00300BAA4B
MDADTFYYLLGGSSLLVLMAGYGNRQRDWGPYLMVAGAAALFVTILVGIHRVF